MATFVKIAVMYTKCSSIPDYADSGSMYGEPAPPTTVGGGPILGVPCKLDSWVTHEFVGNTSNFASNEQT